MAINGFGSTAALIYRCPRCQRAVRRDVPLRELDGQRWYRWSDGRWSVNQEPWGCDCGSFMARQGEIQATFDKGIACTPSCQSAMGPKCVCSCGGTNHGLAFLVKE